MNIFKNQVVRALSAGVLLCGMTNAAHAQAVADFYLPLPEATALTFFDNINTDAAAPLITRTDIVIRDVNTQIIFDDALGVDGPNINAYETQYDIPANWPAGSDTEIWGDNDCSNGFSPNVVGACGAGDDTFTVGEVIVLDQSEAIAGDYFRSNRVINLTRSLWATTSGTLLAGAFELFPTAQWGTSYVVPVGENAPNGNSMFQQTALTIMARQDGTNVTVDPDGPTSSAAALINATLNQGESLNLGMGVGTNGQGLTLNVGATVTSSAPVQTNVLTGDIGSNYESRFYTLFPDALLSSEYYEAVGTTVAGDGVTIFIYNPNSTQIEIDVFDNVDQTLENETLTIPANGVDDLDVATNTGLRLVSTQGEVFTAYTVVDDAGQDHDWGHVTTPLRLMGDSIRVGFAPGKDPLSASTENASPIWVVADEPGSNDSIEICVDNAGDGIDAGPPAGSGTLVDGREYDYTVVVDALDSTRLYDIGPDGTAGVNTNNGSQTGMLAFACDTGTNGNVADPNNVVIAAAWGQDPQRANVALPGFDAGTTIRTGSLNRLFIGDLVFDDLDGDGALDIGEPGIPGVTVTITSSGIDVDPNTPGVQTSHTTVTDKDGFYLFSNLEAGEDYAITVTPPANSTQTLDPDGVNDNTNSLTLSNSTLDVDFAYTVSSLGDRVFLDANQDGDFDIGEGLSDVTVRLTPPAGVDVGAGVGQPTTTLTGSDGLYIFSGLPPGSYTVEVVSGLPALASQTVDPDALLDSTSTVTIVVGSNDFDQDFGYFLTDLSIVKTSSANGQAVSPGDTITYTIVVSNEGSVINENVTLTDVLPAGVTYVNGSAMKTFPTGLSSGTYTSPNLAATPILIDSGTPQIVNQSVSIGDGSPAIPSSATITQLSFDITGEALGQSFINELTLVVDTPTSSPLFSTDFADDLGIANGGGVYTNITNSSAASGAAVGNYQLTLSDDFNDAGDDNRVDNLTFSFDWFNAAGSTTNAANAPANMVVAGDGVDLVPGSSMTVTFEVTVDSPLEPSITDVLNVARATSDQTPTPVEDNVIDPVNAVATCPAPETQFFDFDSDPDFAAATISSTQVVDDEYAPDLIINGVEAGSAIPLTLYPSSATGGADTDLERSNTANVLIKQEPGALGGTPGGPSDPLNPGYTPNDKVGGTTVLQFSRSVVEFQARLVDWENTDASLTFIDTKGTASTLDDETAVVTHGQLNSTSAVNPAFGQDPVAAGAGDTPLGVCEVLGNFNTCDMTNSITAAELGLDRFDRVEYTLTSSGGLDNLLVTYDCNLGIIGDRVFQDLNGNGTYEAGEGLGGVTVSLTPPATVNLGGSGGTVGQAITAVTTVDGLYIFDELPAGEYTVAVTAGLPSGLSNSVDPDGGLDNTADVTLVHDESNLDQDFGYVSDGQNIGDLIFYDFDGNGVFDGADSGIAGVEVELCFDSDLADSADLFDNVAYDNNDGGVDWAANWDEINDDDLATIGSQGIYVAGSALVLDGDTGGDPSIQRAVNLADVVGNVELSLDFQFPGRAGSYDANDEVDVFVLSAPLTAPGAPTGGIIAQTTIDAGALGIPGSTADFNGSITLPFVSPGSIVYVAFVMREFNADTEQLEIENVNVDSTSAATEVCQSTFTNASGIYTFFGRPADDYTITVDPNGTTLPLANIDPVATADPEGNGDGVSAFTYAATGDDLTRDFGYQPNAISGNVSEDTNGDNAGDVGLAGVIVQLYTDPTGTGVPAALVGTAITDANGNYVFNSTGAGVGIPEGDFVVVQIDQAGYSSVNDGDTTPDVGGDAANASILDNLIPVSVATGEIDANNDFVDAQVSSIQGTVWLDEDLDGILDIEETGITSVIVELRDSDDNLIATTVTDASGNYSFDGVLPGNYSVEVISSSVPADLSGTVGNVGSLDVSVVPGDAVRDVNFGYIPDNPTEGAIGDRVWSDADGDGIQDAGEPGIQGVTLSLLDNTGATVGSTTTNANGDYLFTGVPFGTDYVVVIDEAANAAVLGDYDPTVGPQSEGGYIGHPVSLNAATSVVTDVDFGFDSTTANNNTISDTVWFDEDGDGVRDAGEPGIPGITVNLYNDANNDGTPDDADSDGQPDVVASATTGPDGVITFPGLEDGTYIFGVTDNASELSGLTETTAEAIATLSTQVTVTGGVTLPTDTSFGYNNPGLISGTVYSDATAPNSDQDAGEAGFSGITVTLLQDTDNNGSFETTVTTTTTDSGGLYEFDGLPPGSYQVQVTTPPAGATQSEDPDATPNDQTDITLAIGESSVENDFGYNGATGVFDISGTVFLDQDKDGIEDSPAEPGIPGVTLDLIDRDSIETYNIINGMVDYNQDGVISAADNGVVDGVQLIGGNLDIDNDGDIDQDDSGVAGPYNVVEGMISIAQDGVASQSSDFNAQLTADRGIDGNPEGTGSGITGTPYAHTDGSTTTDYWQVDLGLSQPLGEIKVFNRDDCCSDRLSNAWVLVSDTPFPADENDLAGALTNASFSVQLPADTTGIDPVVVLPAGTSGRYIRLQKSGVNVGGDALNFAELKVTPSIIRAPSDGVIATITSDANGDYLFSGLPAGNYSVAVTDSDAQLAGYDLTSGLDVLDATIVAADVTDVDFGYIKEEATGSISGEVWIDENSNTTPQDEETDLPRVDVHLCSSPIEPSSDAPCDPTDDEYITTTTTDTNGEYVFNGLPPGQYVVATDPTDIPAGIEETVTPPAVSLSEGEDVTDVNIGHEPEANSGVLAGVVWTDVDGDGFFDPGEAPIAGVTVIVVIDSQATPADPNPVFLSAVTQADGSWIITGIDETANPVDGLNNLRDGYLIGYTEADIPGTLESSQPTNLPLGDIEYYPVDLLSDPDNVISNLDFGFQPTVGAALGSISGTIYSDLDPNPANLGSYNEAIDGELAGVSVNLIDNATGNVIATVLTDENGFYEFSGLPFGDYQVIVTDTANVTKDLNTNEVISNPITINGANPDATDQNAGFVSDVELNSIGSKFFFDTNGDGNLDEGEDTNRNGVLDLGEDANGNGVLDIGEPGIPGITIQCWLDNDLSETPESPSTDATAVVPQPGVDNLIRTVVTDENGEYFCTSLPAGQYIVVVKDSLNYSATDAVPDTGSTADGEAKNWSYALTLTDNEANYTADFAVAGSNQISGSVIIEDEALVEPNLDGTVDADELDGTLGGVSPDSPAADIPVQLLVLQNGVYEVFSTTTTLPDGTYQFDNLPDGDYIVEVLPDGSSISGFGQTGDPSLSSNLNGNGDEDLVCDSPTDPLCDNRSTAGAITLNGPNDSESGVNFAYQRDFTTTPVTMSFFEATRNGASVEFAWETANEVGNAGFQIYARGEEGWELVSDLIVSLNDDTYTTNSYNYEVSGVTSDWFSLVAVSTQEVVTAHGPFRVGEAYGAHIEAPAEFDWTGIDRKQSSKEEVINSVTERLRKAMREDPEAFQ